MISKKISTILVAGLLMGIQPVSLNAGEDDNFVVVNEEMGVPVFPDDITDRPYKIIGPVKAGVRKATIFSKKASPKKIYKEIWERAEKMGADAAVNATFGKSKISALSWGKTTALAFAVKFLTEEEIAAGVKGETAVKPEEYTKEMFENANKKPKKVKSKE